MPVLSHRPAVARTRGRVWRARSTALGVVLALSTVGLAGCSAMDDSARHETTAESASDAKSKTSESTDRASDKVDEIEADVLDGAEERGGKGASASPSAGATPSASSTGLSQAQREISEKIVDAHRKDYTALQASVPNYARYMRGLTQTGTYFDTLSQEEQDEAVGYIIGLNRINDEVYFEYCTQAKVDGHCDPVLYYRNSHGIDTYKDHPVGSMTLGSDTAADAKRLAGTVLTSVSMSLTVDWSLPLRKKFTPSQAQNVRDNLLGYFVRDEDTATTIVELGWGKTSLLALPPTDSASVSFDESASDAEKFVVNLKPVFVPDSALGNDAELKKQTFNNVTIAFAKVENSQLPKGTVIPYIAKG